MDNTTKIPAPLRSIVENGEVTNTKSVIDERLNHNQEDINVDFLSRLTEVLTNLNNVITVVNNAINIINSHISDFNNPHQLTKTQLELNNVTNDAQVKRTEMGAANGVATLDSNKKVNYTQLYEFIEEYNNVSGFPTIGKSKTIYIDLSDNKTYRYSNITNTYVLLSGGGGGEFPFTPEEIASLKSIISILGIDADGDAYIKKNNENNRNFYTYGDIIIGGKS